MPNYADREAWYLLDKTGHDNWDDAGKASAFTDDCPDEGIGQGTVINPGEEPTEGTTLDHFKPGDYRLEFNGKYKLWMWIDGDSDKISESKGENWNNKVEYNNYVEFTLYNEAAKGKVLKVQYHYTDESKSSEKSYSASEFKWNATSKRWEYNAGSITDF